MNIDAGLIVYLKGADLIAETAFLTLTGKMNFEGRLLAMKRFDNFRFEIESGDPEGDVSKLRDVLDRQSTFYNRNKHGHLLRCTWPGGRFCEGPDRAALQQRLAGDAIKSVVIKEDTEFNGGRTGEGVILKEDRIFLIDSLVEEQDSSVRSSLAQKLQADLGGIPVSVLSNGTLWWLILSAPDESAARAMAEEMAVSERRDRGLLLNPNYQRFEVVSATVMEPTGNV